ncbi:MAG: TonB-dependent receptor, partial [Gemmatimonadota bacterium]
VGEQSVRAERLGYKPVVVEQVVISLGRSAVVRVEMEPEPLTVEGVTVDARRVRLIEPEIAATRSITLGREVRSLPVDRIEEVVELTPGVSGGHFRGGRVGQAVTVLDGLELKNPLEASRAGSGIELPPTALEQVEVQTGGLGAATGSALSGAVSYVTRHGNRDGWRGALSASTDEWAPSSLFHGFTALTLSGDGPFRLLGETATLAFDVQAQGMLDADPRARGLSCVEPGDAPPDLATEIRTLSAAAPGLRCPYSADNLPNQRGDRLLSFARFDAELASDLAFTLSFVGNRLQRELFTPELRYSGGSQLGQRSRSGLTSASLAWSGVDQATVRRLTLRLSWLHLDRYLGAVDPASVGGAGLAGFQLSSFRFLGEDYVTSPIEKQLTTLEPVPGHIAPTGTASPFGPAGAGIFPTGGTPDIANWTRSDVFSADLTGELHNTRGTSIRAGSGARFNRLETYERTRAWLAGSSPNYARFYPVSTDGWIDVKVADEHGLFLTGGLRFDGFRSGIRFQRDRTDFLAPVLDAGWQFALTPRLSIALPIAGSEGRTSIRLNYGRVAQAPDFRFLLDRTIGDSLRAEIQYQGNPELSFERARTYEVGVSQILGENVGVSLTLFKKDLEELASGALQTGSLGIPQYSTSDFGTVKGLEVALRGEWAGAVMRGGYSLQKAVGVGSGTDVDSLVQGDATVIERPLAFDQRHAIDLAVLVGESAGRADARWSGALTGSIRSGYPIDRRAAAGDTVVPMSTGYLPWTALVNLRLSRDLGGVPGCERCRWRLLADGRNLLGRANILGLHRESGLIGPSLAAVNALAETVPLPSGPIPRESPLYVRTIDIDGDGVISIAEFRTARFAAALDRFDPSLFFGEPRQVRLGVEVRF